MKSRGGDALSRKPPRPTSAKPVMGERPGALRPSPAPAWQISLVRLALAVQAGKRIDKAKVAAALAQVPDRVREQA